MIGYLSLYVVTDYKCSYFIFPVVVCPLDLTIHVMTFSRDDGG